MISGTPVQETEVPLQISEAAGETARRAAMPLDQWLDSVSVDTAADAGMASVTTRQPGQDPGDCDGDPLDSLTARLERLAGRRADPPPPPTSPAAASASGGDIDASMRAMELRLAALAIDRTEVDRREGPQRLSEALTRLNARLDRLIAAAPRPASGDHPTSRAEAGPAAIPATPAPKLEVESDLARTQIAGGGPVDHPRAEAGLDDDQSHNPHAPSGGAGATSDLADFERQLRHITEEIELLRQSPAIEQAVAGLRSDLAAVDRHITEAVPQRVLAALQEELHGLSERIDLVNQRAPDATVLSALQHGFLELRAALGPADGMSDLHRQFKALSDKLEILGPNRLDDETIEQFRAAIAELRDIAAPLASTLASNLATTLASNEKITALATDIASIDAKLQAAISSGDAGTFQGLAERIDQLGERLDSRLETRLAPAPHLEALIENLTEKIESLHLSGGKLDTLHHAREQIDRLIEKLDLSQSQFGPLGKLERAISELTLQVKEARAGAIEAVERTARAVAQEMAESTGPGNDVDELKLNLFELRETQAGIDRRTQETLDAFHRTLERLVDRLALIETERQVETPAQTDSAGTITPPNVGRSAGPAPSTWIGVPERQPFSPSFSTNPSTAPGAGMPPRPATERPSIGEAGPAASAVPAGKAHFIAAARRAAQAAAADTSTAEPASTPPRSRVSFAPFSAALLRHRRALMIGVGAFVLMVGSAEIVINALDGSDQAVAPLSRPAIGEPVGAMPETSPAPGTVGRPAAPKTNDSPRLPPAPASGRRTDDTSVITAAAVPAGPSQSQSSGTTAVTLTPALTTPPADLETAGSFAQSRATNSVTPPLFAPMDQVMGTSTPPTSGSEVDMQTDLGPRSTGSSVLRAAALAGNAAAEYEMGMRYVEGRGVAQSFAEAARWLERAATKGVTPAQYRLAGLYEKGRGVKKDLEAARRLYTAAAERGHGKAMHNLAVLYAEGIDGKPDYIMASQWFRKAADRGVADSQYNLGILCARGIGVEQNLVESYKWFALAANQGDRDAAAKRDDIAGRLDTVSLNLARLAVQNWKANPQADDVTTVRPPPGGWDHPVAAGPPRPKAPAVPPRQTEAGAL